MKELFVKPVVRGCLVLCFLVNHSLAQSGATFAVAEPNSISPLMLSRSVDFVDPIPGPGLRMKKTGTALTVAGAVLLIGGVALVSTADEIYYSQTTTQYGTYQEGDPKGAIGFAMLVGGAGMSVTGIILWNKGAKKYRRHLEIQENARAIVGMGGRGVFIGYRF